MVLSPISVKNEGNGCVGVIKVESRKVYLKSFLKTFIHFDKTLTCYSIPHHHLQQYVLPPILSHNVGSYFWPLCLILQYFLEWVHALCDQQYLLIFFNYTGSFLLVVFDEFFFDFFTSFWGDLMTSNICNGKSSLVRIFVLETVSTSGAGGVIYSWYV